MGNRTKGSGRRGMRIYLNVSSLNRPFDDQEQVRIRLEAAAVGMILDRIDDGDWVHVSSEMAGIEIEANPDAERQARAKMLLPEANSIVMLTPEIFTRSEELQKFGFKPADAVHVAAAESAEVDILLSCDDQFCRTGRRCARKLRVRIDNPLAWLDEVERAPDPG